MPEAAAMNSNGPCQRPAAGNTANSGGNGFLGALGNSDSAWRRQILIFSFMQLLIGFIPIIPTIMTTGQNLTRILVLTGCAWMSITGLSGIIFVYRRGSSQVSAMDEPPPTATTTTPSLPRIPPNVKFLRAFLVMVSITLLLAIVCVICDLGNTVNSQTQLLMIPTGFSLVILFVELSQVLLIAHALLEYKDTSSAPAVGVPAPSGRVSAFAGGMPHLPWRVSRPRMAEGYSGLLTGSVSARDPLAWSGMNSMPIQPHLWLNPQLLDLPPPYALALKFPKPIY